MNSCILICVYFYVNVDLIVCLSVYILCLCQYMCSGVYACFYVCKCFLQLWGFFCVPVFTCVKRFFPFVCVCVFVNCAGVHV